MFKVLLVDDEPWILVGLRKSFPWVEMGFEIIAETTNPVEAFELIKSVKPDVVFTDVRMPKISGLELIKKSRGTACDSEFVIVSGFADFSYAQEALRYGAFDYLLKPIQKVDTESILRKLSGHLLTQRSREGRRSLGNDFNGNQLELPQGKGLPDHQDAVVNFGNLLQHINGNYTQELYLKELSERFYINFTYCSELFKKKTGKTFSEYLTQLRMNKAAELLLKGAISVEETSNQVGYHDYYYFNKVFKKHFGTTPSKYKKEGKEA